jgi:hypothetical protein
MSTQLRTEAFCAALLKAGNSVTKIHGKKPPRHRQNRQPSVTVKYASEQPNELQVLNLQPLPGLHRTTALEKTKESADETFLLE